jgi:transcriptional regulator with XRE-family HTH domain
VSLIDEVKARRGLPAPALAREVRRAAGISQERVARELGVARVTVARWECGIRTPRGKLMVAYAALLSELQRVGAA